MLGQFQFEECANLDSVVGKNAIIDYGVGADGEVVMLMAPAKFKAVAFGRQEQKGGIFPFSKAARGYPATFVRVSSSGVLQRTEIRELEVAFPFAQPLPNRKVLIIGARCHYRNGNPEKNAAIFDQDGNILNQFTVGDGISEVQTTNEGLIWVSYFDEGVFGNYGWNEPMGGSGLVCFGSEGQTIWEFMPPDGFDQICDCYSLNVAQNSVWACYYGDFPVVKIDSHNEVLAWENNVAGARALAVYGKRILLFGGYGGNKTRCIMQDFGDKKLTNSRELSLSLPGKADLFGAKVIGRDSILYAFQENSWFSFDLRRIS